MRFLKDESPFSNYSEAQHTLNLNEHLIFNPKDDGKAAFSQWINVIYRLCLWGWISWRYFHSLLQWWWGFFLMVEEPSRGHRGPVTRVFGGRNETGGKIQSKNSYTATLDKVNPILVPHETSTSLHPPTPSTSIAWTSICPTCRLSVLWVPHNSHVIYHVANMKFSCFFIPIQTKWPTKSDALPSRR